MEQDLSIHFDEFWHSTIPIKIQNISSDFSQTSTNISKPLGSSLTKFHYTFLSHVLGNHYFGFCHLLIVPLVRFYIDKILQSECTYSYVLLSLYMFLLFIHAAYIYHCFGFFFLFLLQNHIPLYVYGTIYPSCCFKF